MRLVRSNGNRLDCDECNQKMLLEVIRFDVDLEGYTHGHYVCGECLLEALSDLTDSERSRDGNNNPIEND